MTNRLSPANLTARSAAFAHALAGRLPPIPQLLPSQRRRSPVLRPTAGPAFLPLMAVLAALGLAVGLFAILAWPAYAQEENQSQAPSNLTAELADGQVTLNWEAPALDADSVTGYEVLRPSAATEAVAGNEEPVAREDSAAWSATMTVEWVYQGYGYYSTDAKKAGSLSPASFEVDSTTYTVKMVETRGWMYIGVDRELPFDFVLELDGVRFASGDASFRTYSYGNIYRWERTGLSWRDGDTVEVRLLRTFEDETAVNSAATGAPTISGTAQVGETLTAGTSGIEDTDGLDNAAFTYQWLADDTQITGATGSTYTLADADEGKSISVRVSFSDDAGNEETLTSEATDAVAATPNNPATGAPTISGTAQVGETLTADTSGIADEDGVDNASLSYQWLADDTDMSGATDSTYTLADTDEGKAIKVRVSFTDDGGNEEELTSEATETVNFAVQPQIANSPATGTPTISGTAQVGETLTADTSGAADEDGLDNAVFNYQWLADDAEIAGATASTYTLADADDGKAIQVRVSFTDDGGNDETLTSAATAAVTAPEPPARPTGLTAEVSHDSVTLTWDDPNDDSITGYVILRRDKDIHEEGTFETVESDTGSAGTTYTDDTVEPEKQYVYRIKAINANGVSEISSWVRGYTPAAPTPEPPAAPTGLSATATRNQVVLTWNDPQNDTITGYMILRRNRDTDAQGQFTNLVEDTGIAGATHTDGTVAAETPYTYRIKAINAAGTSERSRWFHIDTPAAPTPEPTPEPTPAPTAEPESVSEGDTDLPNDNSTPGRVAVGGSATGAIGTDGDQDRFAVELVAERTYQFDQTGSPGGGGTLPDTFFRAIYNSEGDYQPDSYNDDFDGGRDSRVTFTPTESGTYYARVSGDRDEVGSYTLSVTDVTPEQGADVTPEPPAEPTPEPPDKPTGLSTVATYRTVTLTWDDPQDDGITGYVIVRLDIIKSKFTAVAADTGTANPSYTDGTVEPETQYSYQIKAVNAHGESENSAWVNAKTLVAPDPALLAPTNLTVELTDGQVAMSWNAPVEDAGSVDGYEILRTRGEDEPTILVADTGNTATAHTDETADAPGESYAYRVKAIRDGKKSQDSNQAVIQLPDPPSSAPSGLTAGFAGGGMALTWQAPTQDAVSVTGYEILRARGEGGLTILVADTGNTATAYTDATTTGASEYYAYRVRAIRDGERSQDSNEARVQLPTAAPQRVSSASSSDTVILAWHDPQDDGITGYRILRRDQDGDFQTLVENTGSAAATYTDDTVEPERMYTYRVLAISSSGVSEPSRDVEVSTTAPVEPPEPLSSQSAHAVSTLLGNLSQATFADGFILVGERDSAQEFTTGSNAAGYNLSGVKLDISEVPETPADVSVELWSATGGATPEPQARIATLTHSTGTFRIGINTFNAPAGTRLTTGTTYFLFTSYVGTTDGDLGELDLKITLSTSTDAGSTPGWSIGRRFHRTHSPQGAWVHTDARLAAPTKFSMVGSFDFATEDVSEPSGDLPADASTTGRILVNGTVTGSISSADDVDWFAALLHTGHKYQIDVEGDETNQGTLTDPSLNELQGYSPDEPTVIAQVTGVTDDNSGDGGNARKVFELPEGYETGTYYIAVGSGNNATGTYRLRLRQMIQPHGGPKVVQASLEPGDTASGTFERNKWYYFALEGLTPGRYTVSFNRGPIYTLYAPMTGADGDLLYVITNQPRGVATHAFDVRPRTTQTRYVEIYVDRDAGDYTVTLKKTRLNLVAGGPAVTSEISGRELGMGTSFPPGPWGVAMKFFGVELLAGERYTVNIRGLDTGAGTLDEPMLGNIVAPDGSYVSGASRITTRREYIDSNDVLRIDRTVRHTFTANQDGTHYVKAGGRLYGIKSKNDNNVLRYLYAYRAGTFKISVSGKPPPVVPTCTLNTGDIWCGVVTVGELPGAYGYNESRGVGYLSDTDFDVGTNSYTIAVLSVTKQGLQEGSGSGSLTFSINPRPGAAEHAEILGMELHVNSDRFNVSDAVAGALGYYYWTGSVANLNWSGEDYIIAQLRPRS